MHLNCDLEHAATSQYVDEIVFLWLFCNHSIVLVFMSIGNCKYAPKIVSFLHVCTGSYKSLDFLTFTDDRVSLERIVRTNIKLRQTKDSVVNVNFFEQFTLKNSLLFWAWEHWEFWSCEVWQVKVVRHLRQINICIVEWFRFIRFCGVERSMSFLVYWHPDEKMAHRAIVSVVKFTRSY